MERVYSETYLNLSATHAADSQGGLFRPRIPELLLEDEITLNIEGLPGAHPPPQDYPPEENIVQAPAQPPPPTGPSTGRKLIRFLGTFWYIHYVFMLLRLLHDELGDFLELDSIPRNEIAENDEIKLQSKPTAGVAMSALQRTSTKLGIVNALRRSGTTNGKVRRTLTAEGTDLSEDDSPYLRSEAERHDLKRCTILDASFWFDRVDDAPVNRRAWVLQERLMSPRVLHFCHDQVAWECCGFDAAEGQPEGMPNFQLTPGGIINEESRLKGLEVKSDGARLRTMRLANYNEPDRHLGSLRYALELWRRIVEVYSKTHITNSEDKLIALSGMAKLMAGKIGRNRPARYAAGLWEPLLECQLLWRVEPVWRDVGEYFENLSTTPEIYRAPSWSWASVDAQMGHGITYGDITDRDLLIRVEDVSVRPWTNNNPPFGIVSEKETYIDIWGKLRRAVLYPKEPVAKGRFGWHLVDRGDLDREEHTNIYLDCPGDNAKNGMFGLDHDKSCVYVIPAAVGPRTASNETKYLTCLLVQHYPRHSSGPVFKRIGITKLSQWADSKTLEISEGQGIYRILEHEHRDVDMPHLDYDSRTGMHKIRLI
ncbi:hypothetical protein E8E12_003757 [Didymella heteroderae]|uniref:Heterokaryon incompatibility domain-containing protein n=1 Tax=Didymella heteroderae TaxID=1769908 RepID=A0A9P4WL06_9PLEO|nr:hypothetical protein E8E12_003757 [Didymella heteroderae]